MRHYIAAAIALAAIVLSPPAEARRSSNPGSYTIRCAAAECSDRYHYRAPRAERPFRSYEGRSRFRY